MKVKGVVLEEKETDMCLLESHEERLKIIDTDLQGIKCDILLIEDYESQQEGQKKLCSSYV